jgi:hypothetical protein
MMLSRFDERERAKRKKEILLLILLFVFFSTIDDVYRLLSKVSTEVMD